MKLQKQLWDSFGAEIPSKMCFKWIDLIHSFVYKGNSHHLVILFFWWSRPAWSFYEYCVLNLEIHGFRFFASSSSSLVFCLCIIRSLNLFFLYMQWRSHKYKECRAHQWSEQSMISEMKKKNKQQKRKSERETLNTWTCCWFLYAIIVPHTNRWKIIKIAFVVVVLFFFWLQKSTFIRIPSDNTNTSTDQNSKRETQTVFHFIKHCKILFSGNGK